MANQNYILEDREFLLVLDRQGNLSQMKSPNTADEGLFDTGKEQKTNFFWSLEIDDEDCPQKSLTFTTPVIEKNVARLKGSNEHVIVDLEVVIDAIGPLWSMSVYNRDSGRITSANFTLVDQFSFGPESYCTFPYCAGWALPIGDLAEEERFSLDYPVKASMQWISAYRNDEGVYFGIHDSVPLYKELVIRNRSIQWKLSHLDLRTGEHKRLPPVYLIPHRSGWRGGAKYYQSWAMESIKTPDTPKWYAQKPTWAWVGLRGQHQETPWHETTYLPEISMYVAGAGVDLIQLTAYTEQGHDTLYPDYVPGPSIGGEAGLRQAVEAIHKAGKRISLYTNGRVVDPAASVSLENRELWGVRATPGSQVFTEQYGDVVFDVMCPGAAGWRELFIGKLEYLVKEFDIDGIYVDQISGCRSLPCYADNHDHIKPNEAWSFYRQFIKELRERITHIKPDIFLSTEGVNDLLGQYFDSQQAHNDWTTLTRDRGISLPDLFHSTFPEQLLNVGCITQEKSGWYYLKLAHVSGGGCDFGVWDWKEMPTSFIKKAKSVIEWHADHSESFRFGKIVPIHEEMRARNWKVNAFYQPSKIIVNGAWLGEEPESRSVPQCSVFVSFPEGTLVSTVQKMEGCGVTLCEWSGQEDGLRIRFGGGKDELAGVAIELAKQKNPLGQLYDG